MKFDSRYQAAAAIVVALILSARLPQKLTLGPYWVAAVLVLGLLLPLLFVGRRMDVRVNRAISVALVATMTVFNLASVVLLILDLTGARKIPHGVGAVDLLRTGALIWLTNVIVFSLWFWEVDRESGYPDFLFPQLTLKDTNPTCAPTSWEPMYLDYLYVSFTNALAFSPTDVMPLSRLAKMLMLVESLISFTTVAVVLARSINILS